MTLDMSLIYLDINSNLNRGKMAARLGLSKADVIDTAFELLEETQNVQAVTMTAVAARLGIRVQSLYAHVDGTQGLQREIALRSLQKLAQRLNQAAIGVAGIDAVRSVLQAQLFRLKHQRIRSVNLPTRNRSPNAEAIRTLAIQCTRYSQCWH